MHHRQEKPFLAQPQHFGATYKISEHALQPYCVRMANLDNPTRTRQKRMGLEQCALDRTLPHIFMKFYDNKCVPMIETMVPTQSSAAQWQYSRVTARPTRH